MYMCVHARVGTGIHTVLLISLSQETAPAITLHLLDLIKEPLFPAEAEASQPLV